METIFGIQVYTLVNGVEVPIRRVRIFSGTDAEKVSNDFLERFARIYNFEEVNKRHFNLRLFKKSNYHSTFYVELCKLDCD